MQNPARPQTSCEPHKKVGTVRSFGRIKQIISVLKKSRRKGEEQIELGLDSKE